MAVLSPILKDTHDKAVSVAKIQATVWKSFADSWKNASEESAASDRSLQGLLTEFPFLKWDLEEGQDEPVSSVLS